MGIVCAKTTVELNQWDDDESSNRNLSALRFIEINKFYLVIRDQMRPKLTNCMNKAAHKRCEGLEHDFRKKRKQIPR